ncbi:MAG: cytochrome b/b6 domain-containing protein [Hyphomicrobiaceae bacterium]
MLLNTRDSYGLVAQVLHWITAVLILTMLLLGAYMQQLPSTTADQATAKFWWFSLHKTIGVATFVVALVRVFWALLQPRPRLLNADRRLENFAAQTVHWLLYGAIIAMPITGWLHHAASEGFAPIWWPLPQNLPMIPKDEQLASVFASAHFYTAILLGTSVGLHIAGALKHALVDRDETLNRMIPGAAATTHHRLPDERPGNFPVFLAFAAFFAIAIASTLPVGTKTGSPDDQKIVRTTVSAGDTDWRIDHSKSQLAIQVMQSGTPVAGVFERWRAQIAFDPDNLGQAHIDVEVDVSSLALGGVSKDAKSDGFLNVAAFPSSRFVARKIMKTGDSSYEAQGMLTLVGETHPLFLPFRITIKDNRASAVAEVALDRLAFGIGKKGFPGGGLIGLEVLVKVKIEAERVKAP